MTRVCALIAVSSLRSKFIFQAHKHNISIRNFFTTLQRLYVLLPYGADWKMLAGHSLGGALAVLAAFDVKKLGQKQGSSPKVTCITFGSPRVGNHAFCKEFEVSSGSIFLVILQLQSQNRGWVVISIISFSRVWIWRVARLIVSRPDLEPYPNWFWHLVSAVQEMVPDCWHIINGELTIPKDLQNSYSRTSVLAVNHPSSVTYVRQFIRYHDQVIWLKLEMRWHHILIAMVLDHKQWWDGNSLYYVRLI